MSDHSSTEEPKSDDESVVDSRRNFLKSAGIAGLGVSAASVTGLVGLTASDDAEAAPGVTYGASVPDPSREDLGGAPVYDKQRAFGQPLLKPLKNRVLTLKRLMINKGIIGEAGINGLVQYYSEQVGPYIGKAVVAKCWTDPAFKHALLNPTEPYKNYASSVRGPFAATLYIRDYLDEASQQGLLSFNWKPQMGLLGTTLGPEGEYVRVVANGRDQATGEFVHNLVVCTLCSCYPQALLGVQPEWYKSRQYRARSISAPRGVIMEFAQENGNQIEVEAYLNKTNLVKVWDSNSEIRFLVIPEAPAGVALTPGNEKYLATLVSRNGMIGTQIL